MSPDPLQPIPIHILRQLVSRVVVQRLLRCARVSKDTRPLLDALIEARNVERLVDVAVENLHAWVLAGVAGVHGFDLCGPFRRGFVQGALGALGVPAAHGVGVEATGWLAAKLRCRGEDVGVNGGHDLLVGVLARCNNRMDSWGRTVIIAPDDSPVT
jgi:hypothetical protein